MTLLVSSLFFCFSVINLGVFLWKYSTIKQSISRITAKNLHVFVNRDIQNYINLGHQNLEQILSQIFADVEVATDYTQTLIDNESQLAKLNQTIEKKNSFQRKWKRLFENKLLVGNAEDYSQIVLWRRTNFNKVFRSNNGLISDTAQPISRFIRKLNLLDILIPSIVENQNSAIKQLVFMGPPKYTYSRSFPPLTNESELGYYPGFADVDYWDYFIPNAFPYWINEKKSLSKKSTFILTPIYKDAITNKPSISLLAPVWSKDDPKKAEGAIIADIFLEDVSPKYFQKPILESGFTLLTNEKGAIFNPTKANLELLQIKERQEFQIPRVFYRSITQNSLQRSSIPEINNLQCDEAKRDVTLTDGKKYFIICKKLDLRRGFVSLDFDGIQRSEMQAFYFVPRTEIDKIFLKNNSFFKDEFEERFFSKLILFTFLIILLCIAAATSIFIVNSRYQRLIINLVRQTYGRSIPIERRKPESEIIELVNSLDGMIQKLNLSRVGQEELIEGLRKKILLLFADVNSSSELFSSQIVRALKKNGDYKNRVFLRFITQLNQNFQNDISELIVSDSVINLHQKNQISKFHFPLFFENYFNFLQKFKESKIEKVNNLLTVEDYLFLDAERARLTIASTLSNFHSYYSFEEVEISLEENDLSYDILIDFKNARVLRSLLEIFPNLADNEELDEIIDLKLKNKSEIIKKQGVLVQKKTNFNSQTEVKISWLKNIHSQNVEGQKELKDVDLYRLFPSNSSETSWDEEAGVEGKILVERDYLVPVFPKKGKGEDVIFFSQEENASIAHLFNQLEVKDFRAKLEMLNKVFNLDHTSNDYESNFQMLIQQISRVIDFPIQLERTVSISEEDPAVSPNYQVKHSEHICIIRLSNLRENMVIFKKGAFSKDEKNFLSLVASFVALIEEKFINLNHNDQYLRVVKKIIRVLDSVVAIRQKSTNKVELFYLDKKQVKKETLSIPFDLVRTNFQQEFKIMKDRVLLNPNHQKFYKDLT